MTNAEGLTTRKRAHISVGLLESLDSFYKGCLTLHSLSAPEGHPVNVPLEVEGGLPPNGPDLVTHTHNLATERASSKDTGDQMAWEQIFPASLRTERG